MSSYPSFTARLTSFHITRFEYARIERLLYSWHPPLNTHSSGQCWFTPSSALLHFILKHSWKVVFTSTWILLYVRNTVPSSVTSWKNSILETEFVCKACNKKYSLHLVIVSYLSYATMTHTYYTYVHTRTHTYTHRDIYLYTRSHNKKMPTTDNTPSSLSEGWSPAPQALNWLKPGIQECDTLQVYIDSTVITSHVEPDTRCLQWSSTSM